MHILLQKQSNLKILGQFENLGFVIMPTRENLRLIARALLTFMKDFDFHEGFLERFHALTRHLGL